MKILLTGHKGYIGAVGGPMLQSAGHDVVGLDSDLYAGCDFGPRPRVIPELRKDLRDLTRRTWKASMPWSILRHCRTIRWAISTRS